MKDFLIDASSINFHGADRLDRLEAFRSKAEALGVSFGVQLHNDENEETIRFLHENNVPLTGHNPPRYLEAEFNYFEVETEDGACIRVQNNAHIQASKIRLRASVGNIQHAAWLKPEGDSFGGVWLTATGEEKVAAPITADTPYLADADTDWLTLDAPGQYIVRMEAKGIGAFGDKWCITLE